MEKTAVVDLPRRISLADAARVAGCADKRTVAAALVRHGFPIVRLGRKCSVLVSDVEKLIELCTSYPADKVNGVP